MIIGNAEIVPAVMNAACSIAKTPEDITKFSETNAGAVVLGSITIEERAGNPLPRYFKGDGYALNSFGMPNGGIDYYERRMRGMSEVVHDAGKVFIVNVAGFNAQEYAVLANLAQRRGADVVELNFGCPNVISEGVQEPIASFDTDYMQEIIAAVSDVTDIPITVKLSPYSNPEELKKVAAIINSLDRVTGVVTSNTIPNSYMPDKNGDPVLANKVGGMSGRALQPFALGQVLAFKKELNPDKVIIGAGGIENRRDVKRYKNAGAHAVQAATLMLNSPFQHRAINRLGRLTPLG